MTTNRNVYHVVPDSGGNQWLVTDERDDRVREQYGTKAEAVEAAKNRARQERPSQVKVHKSDGNMEYESTYEDDPRRSPS